MSSLVNRLMKELWQTLKSIKKAFKIVVPKESEQDTCFIFKIPTFKKRLDSLFKGVCNAMTDPHHRLHNTIPVKRHLVNRSNPIYELLKCKTERHTSFIPWCLFHGQSNVVKY